MQTTTHSPRVDELPAELESAQSKLVYLSLEATGEATATDLQEALGLRKLAILSVVGSLSSRGLLEETEAGYVTAAAATDPITA
ncbi:hypothetical protein A6E15_15065 [Natrinema saccharevitans]|uniref:MarR family transcriptional regulator n=1 Tax=Natrinema saccharevitans TaxID=301967 RepID=A0A1S8B037_9EURY|nr:MarR family transcriptional regulator [Natrinema saccharevitans]OLZ42206.1 hypothetical protein A6E15_15065 [Natrinema saccharevitans]